MAGRHEDLDHDNVADWAEDHPWLEDKFVPARRAAAAAMPGGIEGGLRDALSAVGAPLSRIVRPLPELAAGAADALRQAPEGLTAVGAASFLATCAQESAYFRALTESGSESYLRGKDYWPYVGRGFIQCTWERNYALFGAWCRDRGLVDDPDIFVDRPAALADYRWAWLVAVWYFATCGLEQPISLWPYANRGDHYAVSQGVNRGPRAIGTSKVPNGWDERRDMFDALRAVGDALLPTPAAPPRPKELPKMIERPLVAGHNVDTVCIPVGSVSGLVAAAWVSVRARGGVAGTVYFQASADTDGAPPGAGAPFPVAARNARRAWAQIPDGTEYIEYDLTAAGPGSLLIEMQPK